MPHSELARQLKAIGDPTRLRILVLLPCTKTCQGGYNVSQLADELGVPQPTVSHHLKILFQADLIRCEKMCRDAYYWINEPAVEEVCEAFRAICQCDPAQGAAANSHRPGAV